MPSPPIFFDPRFVANVIAGFLVTVLGAVVLFVAGLWFAQAGEWLRAERKPTAWRALCAIGVALFLLGLLWQFIGYGRVGAVTWRSP